MEWSVLATGVGLAVLVADCVPILRPTGAPGVIGPHMPVGSARQAGIVPALFAG